MCTPPLSVCTHELPAAVTPKPKAIVLRISSRMIGIIGLACTVSNYVVTNDLLTSTSAGLWFLYWLHVREYSTAIARLRCRLLQEAFQANDTEKFSALQADLTEHMFLLLDATDNLFAHRAMNDGVTNPYYTVPQIPMNISYFPYFNEVTAVNFTLQQVTEVGSGLAVASLDFEAFGSIETNNYWRFVMDNAPLIQTTAYDYSMTVLSNTSRLEELITERLQIFAALFLVQKFRQRQKNFTNLFKAIPRSLLSDQILYFEENSIEEMFGSELVSNEDLRRRNGNLQSRNFAVLDQFGDMRTFSIRSLLDVRDVKVNFDKKTWVNREELTRWVNWDVGYMEMTFGHVQFGDDTRYPPAPAIDTYSQALMALFDITCLPYDETICQDRVYDPSVGFTNATVSNGVVTLTQNAQNAFQAVRVATNLGEVFNVSQATIALLDYIIEPDLVDGYHRGEELVLSQTTSLLNNFENTNMIFLIVELIGAAKTGGGPFAEIIAFGQLFVFRVLVQNFALQQECNVDLVMRLPSAILRAPSVSAVLRAWLTQSSPPPSKEEDPSQGEWLRWLRRERKRPRMKEPPQQSPNQPSPLPPDPTAALLKALDNVERGAAVIEGKSNRNAAQHPPSRTSRGLLPDHGDFASVATRQVRVPENGHDNAYGCVKPQAIRSCFCTTLDYGVWFGFEARAPLEKTSVRCTQSVAGPDLRGGRVATGTSIGFRIPEAGSDERFLGIPPVGKATAIKGNATGKNSK
ncbi:hypothetical protein BDK51DRAFT_27722 [Blyttiomyces helicus]|uniref:Uncharacterized protein n=1 Tax=Blyttiomyces helicus TaxID=388810 RepID=A0A4P9WI10_9FUNG|nr:hypothetical protein BDK51DRAFT_27722 [Blyttiomyces helicus]|eukprot:RKO92489.1 hypothetical protein BDK51DRAFT_27722 [Blyttiomyces helicus]